ncbi:MAG: iron permease [Pirellulaceae bacterium]|nr:MAG: iron permease [Pirellulaceae bacterium]
MELLLLCAAIYAASWLGGSLPTWWHWTHTRLQLVLSFVGGLVLGVGLLHLLPHGIAIGRSLETAMPAALGGLLMMFFLIRIFHVHSHAPHDTARTVCHHGIPHAHGIHQELWQSVSGFPEHEQPQDETAALDSGCGSANGLGRLAKRGACPPSSGVRFGWVGLAVGLSLHMLLDGVTLAASWIAADNHGDGVLVLGPFLAILLHEPLDVMSITTVMQSAGYSRRQVMLWSLGFGTMCPLGAALGYWGLVPAVAEAQTLLGAILAFSAGMFLCIALSDILPELQFHAHDRWPLSCALLAGVFLAYALGWLEPHEWHHWQEPPHTMGSHAAPPHP